MLIFWFVVAGRGGGSLKQTVHKGRISFVYNTYNDTTVLLDKI